MLAGAGEPAGGQSRHATDEEEHGAPEPGGAEHAATAAVPECSSQRPRVIAAALPTRHATEWTASAFRAYGV